MKSLSKNSVFVILLFGITIYFSSCNKEVTLPDVITIPVTNITHTSALAGVTVTDDGGAEVNDIGVCWSTSPNPTVNLNKSHNNTGITSFTNIISGLTANTKYFVRAFATNSAGTGYGNEVTFTTKEITAYGNLLNFTTASFTEDQIIFNPYLTYGLVTDVEGNIYKTIRIGTQTWMAENLKTTKYFDGVNIPNVIDFTEWSGLTTGAYCWYYNDVLSYKDNYGALYNWFAVNTGKLCPEGWHVPTDGEWVTLTTYLGGQENAGGKLKETGNTHWQSQYNWENPYPLATNESGFTALPGGTRNVFVDPDFDDWSWISMAGYWWSASGSIYDSAIYWAVINSTNKMHTTFLLFEQSGFSVRCVKD